MKTIKGDLIKLAEEGKFDVIIHGCNCFHAMGGGIAKQLADKYPEVEEADKQSEFGDPEKLGSYSVASIFGTDYIHKFIVINAYTQYSFSLGKDVFEYDSFEKFLNDFKVEILIYPNWESPKNKIQVGFPMIGAGLAGGDWSRISKMIEKFSEDVASYADVTVVEYQP